MSERDSWLDSVPAVQKGPLCVDLDGTLIRTNLQYESVLLLLKRNLLYVLLLPFWLLKGRARLKREVASRVSIDVALLPYNRALLDYIRQEYVRGRRIVLAAASDLQVAKQVAGHLGVFSDVIASDGETNRSGPIKAAKLEDEFTAGRSRVRAALAAIRLHHWSKNLLVAVPVITSHRWADPEVFARSALAFIAFSLCASSVYVTNDLMDLEADRRHPTKKARPFAAGHLSIPAGLLLAFALLAAGSAVATQLPVYFGCVLAVYWVLTLAYSSQLKRRLLVDVYALAGLYTARVLAGGAATGIVLSPWLLAFSTFLFLSLAVLKRFSELRAVGAAGSMAGRSYVETDYQGLAILGMSSGMIAILVLALYINSPQMAALYRFPEALWAACPLLMYWHSRLWFIANRGHLAVDPVLFTLRDPVSHLVGACLAATLLIASFGLPI